MRNLKISSLGPSGVGTISSAHAARHRGHHCFRAEDPDFSKRGDLKCGSAQCTTIYDPCSVTDTGLGLGSRRDK